MTAPISQHFSTTAPRLERKCLLSAVEAATIDTRLLAAGWHVAHPSRYVYSLYFDTPELTDFRTHRDGNPCRAKHRLRAYAQARLPLPDEWRQWEIKQRRGALSFKVVVPATAAPPPGFACRLPTMLVRYRRLYWWYAGQRLTVDTDLAFSALHGSWPSSPNWWPMPASVAVVESKSPATVEARAPLVDLPWRMQKFSKYIFGMGWLW